MFSEDGKAATTEFAQGAGGKWTLTAFAELANDAMGKDVSDSQIKVYAAATLEGLGTASPMTSGVEVRRRAPSRRRSRSLRPTARRASSSG